MLLQFRDKEKILKEILQDNDHEQVLPADKAKKHPHILQDAL